MLVRMVKTAAGPDGVYSAGEVWQVSDALASGMIAGGYATAVDAVPAAPTAERPGAKETTQAPGAPARRGETVGKRKAALRER